MKKKFEEFLKKHECWDEFVKETKTQPSGITLDNFIDSGTHNFLAMSFIWDKSHAGYDLWEEIDDLWQAELRKEANNA